MSLLFSFFLLAQIIEIQHFEEIHDHLNKEELVILDIDNTLIEPTQELGTDQWFNSQIRHYEKQGYETTDALEKALSEWMAVQNITKMRPVEPNIPQIVQNLQDQGFTVIGLTTRGLGLSTRTIEQLKSVGIDLSVTAPTKGDIFFMNDRGVLFRNGILFTANTHKGSALFKYLHEANLQPKSILFVNDKRSHIMPVEQFAENHKIPFKGLRYGFLDERVRNLDTTLTDVQFSHFGKILSNEEAKEMLQGRSTQ